MQLHVHQQLHRHAWNPQLIETTAAWNLAVHAIQSDRQAIRGGEERDTIVYRLAHEPSLVRALALISERGLHPLLMAWALEGARSRLATHAVPQFWQKHSELLGIRKPPSVSAQRACVGALFHAVEQLHSFVDGELRLLHLLEKHGGTGSTFFIGNSEDEVPSGTGEVLTHLQTLLLASPADAQSFHSWMALCWRRLFVDITRHNREATEGDEDDDGGGGDDDEDEPQQDSDPMDLGGPSAEVSSERLRHFCGLLHALRWLPLIETTLSGMLHEHFRATLCRRCARVFDKRLLALSLSWLDQDVLLWLRLLLQPHLPPDAPPSTPLQQWQARLRFFFLQSLASLRISELFDVIVDYPDSLPALEDLKECLQQTHQHSDIVTGLGAATELRLLKPGVDTSNIIQVYVCAIRALRVLDPSGLTLEAVSERVRVYLKERADTVRQIVTSLTDPESAELLDLVGSSSGQVLQDDGALDDLMIDLDEARGDEAAMMLWMPDPVAANRGSSLCTRRASDVLAILVGIYGSKALFVNEFRSMLADKLLAAPGYDTEREVRHLELLKKRFGDSAMQSCEVMLHDVAESRRISRSIHSHFGNIPAAGDGSSSLIDATVVSRLCWPTLTQDVFELPASVKREMERYEKQFMHLKAPRKLVWKPTLGCVTLDVSFADKEVKDITCTPLQATILLRFGEQRRWELPALASSLKTGEEALKKKMSFWINRGFVVEISRTSEGCAVYEAVSSLGSGGEARQQAEEDDESGSAATTSQAEQLAAEMRVFEQYVVGMLTNLESLPLQRIHNMLKMFVPATGGERGYDRSEQELHRFLNHLVEDGKLELSAGQYSIRRST